MNIKFISEEDYLSGELVSEVRHEYVGGQVYAMAGASKNHERIAGNIYRKLGNHLENSPCEPFGSDMKVKTSAGSFRYPDCMVVCNDESGSDYHTESPVILVEVLSRSTRKTDEKDKLVEYMNMPTLQEYVIIEQDVVDITVYRKSEEWRSQHYFLGEDIHFLSIDLTLLVEDLYHRVDNEDMVEFLEKQNH